MGLLDDAIREHLELKRRHGADPAEVDREEQEALGPARRGAPAAEDAGGTAASESGAVSLGTLSDAEERDDRDDDDRPEVGRDDEPAPSVPAGEPEAPVAPPAPGDEPEGEGEGGRPELAQDLPGDVGPGSLTDDPPDRPDLEPPAATGEQDTGAVVAPRQSEPGDASPPRARGDGSEDVLEETPEFLQETPEHDRLWFEQKPPRDFDF